MPSAKEGHSITSLSSYHPMLLSVCHLPVVRAKASLVRQYSLLQKSDQIQAIVTFFMGKGKMK